MTDEKEEVGWAEGPVFEIDGNPEAMGMTYNEHPGRWPVRTGGQKWEDLEGSDVTVPTWRMDVIRNYILELEAERDDWKRGWLTIRNIALRNHIGEATKKVADHPGRWPVYCERDHEAEGKSIQDVKDYILELEARVKELEEYKVMYEGLCK